jgi:hypothetical protein
MTKFSLTCSSFEDSPVFLMFHEVFRSLAGKNPDHFYDVRNKPDHCSR